MPRVFRPSKIRINVRDHSPTAIAERLDKGPEKSYLKDFIYGAIDGAVTTFAVVTGVAGAGLSSGIIIVLGLANLLADGFSMGISNFLGSRAENQKRAKIRKDEAWEIENFPAGEREEIRQIYAKKGFKGKQLEQLVDVITSDKKLWIDTMIQDEHGLPLEDSNPWYAGAATVIAFILVGFIPLITFIVNWFFPGLIAQPFLGACLLTALAFALVGTWKGIVVEQNPLWSALETMSVGGVAALLAYGVGYFLKGLVG